MGNEKELKTFKKYKGKEENFIIPEGIENIDYFAFYQKNKIKTIRLPNTLLSLDKNIFSKCNKLESIIVDENNPRFKSVDGVLFNKDCSTLICYPQKSKNKIYKTLDSVKSIGQDAFANCEYLEEIIFPEGIECIGNFAFKGCKNLKKIIIPNGIKKLGAGLFGDCKKLEIFTLPNSIKKISAFMFSYCESLKQIYLPKSIKKISLGVFYECKNLSEIFYNGSEQEWKTMTIENKNDCINKLTIHFNYNQDK